MTLPPVRQSYRWFIGKWCVMSNGYDTVAGVILDVYRVNRGGDVYIMTVDGFGMWVTKRFEITSREEVHR